MVDAVIKVGIDLIFVFEYGSFADGRYRKFDLFISFVESLIENQVTFHFGTHYFPIFHIVGRGVNLTDILLHDSTVRVGVKWNVDVGIRRTFGFEYLDFCFVCVHKPEFVVNQVVAGGIL